MNDSNHEIMPFNQYGSFLQSESSDLQSVSSSTSISSVFSPDSMGREVFTPRLQFLWGKRKHKSQRNRIVRVRIWIGRAQKPIVWTWIIIHLWRSPIKYRGGSRISSTRLFERVAIKIFPQMPTTSWGRGSTPKVQMSNFSGTYILICL